MAKHATRARPATSKLSAIISYTSFYYLFTVLGGLLFWSHSRSPMLDPIQLTADSISNRLQVYHALKGARFIPARDPGIEYIGRWTWTADKSRADCDFPGSYFEFVVYNSTLVYLSLHNADPSPQPTLAKEDRRLVNAACLDVRPLGSKSKSNPPASLLTQVDRSDFRLFSGNAKGLLALTSNGMDASVDHKVRVTLIADGEGSCAGPQVQGIWVDEGAQLVSVSSSWKFRPFPENSNVGELASSKGNVGSRATNTTGEIYSSAQSTKAMPEDTTLDLSSSSPKYFEVVTDVPTSDGGHGNSTQLPSVSLSWEELVGDALEARSLRISLEGVCLTKICGGKIGDTTGIREAYFRSGLPGSPSFNKPWSFDGSTPSVVVMLLGHSDSLSPRYNAPGVQDQRKFAEEFEREYIHLVQGIRKAAYPIHPAAWGDYQNDGDGFVYNSAPATTPILIVAPFTEALQQSTQRVVQKLQDQGDRSVFWIDSSGWFSFSDFYPTTDRGDSRQRVLNARGTRKAALYMHAHLCHYLHPDQSRCHFFPHGIYTGQVYIPEAVELEKLLEELKVQKLKALFSGGS